MPSRTTHPVSGALAVAMSLLAAAIPRLAAADGGTSQLASGVVGLMSNAAQLAQAGDFKALADLSNSNPAFAIEVLSTGLQNAGANRAGLIEAVLATSPEQKVVLATAVTATTTPSQFQAEVPALLAGLTPAQMVSVATKALPRNPSIATNIAIDLGLRSGVPQAKLASLLVVSNPAAAAGIVSGLMYSVTGLSNDALAVAYASIAVAAAERAPTQAAAIAACPASMVTAAVLIGSSLQITFSATVASAVAKAVPSQAAAITKAVLESYPSSWVGNFPTTSAAIVNAIAQAIAPEQRPAIAAAAEAAAKGRQDATRAEISYLQAAQMEPITSTAALADKAIADAKVATAMPLPMNAPTPTATSGAVPAKNTPPLTPPIDPTANVSRSS